MSRLKLLMLTAIAMLLMVAGLALHWNTGADGSLERARKAGLLRIGYAVEAPYAFLTPQGVVTGQSPELAQRLALRLGIPNIEWRLVEFGELISELRQGRIDVIAAGMFITRERAALVNFSDPIFWARPGLLVARGNPYGLHSFTDILAQEQVRVAVLSGAVEGEALRKAGLDEERLVVVPDAQTGRVAVQTGLADALALSAPTINWMVLRQPPRKTEVARPFSQPGRDFDSCQGYGAFVFRKEDTELLAAWNREQRAYFATQEYRQLMEDFGFGPEEMPGNVTLKEILTR